jgi:hypothetical protein
MGLGYLVIGFGRTYEIVLLGLAIGGLGVGLLTPNMTVMFDLIHSSSLTGTDLGWPNHQLFSGSVHFTFCQSTLSQWVGLSATYGLAGGSMLLLALIALGVMSRWK